jgi:hypothetical protein
MPNKYLDLLRLISYLWYMFHLPFFGSIIEAAEFENEFFLGEKCNTKKKVRLIKLDLSLIRKGLQS